MTRMLRAELFERLMRQDVGFFDEDVSDVGLFSALCRGCVQQLYCRS
jgi:hypothetical protein